MESTDYARFILAFAFVVGLIWATAALAKRFGLDKKFRGITNGKGRLAVTESLYLDSKRKLVIIRADQKEYLLFVAGEHAQLIDKMGQPSDGTI